MAIGINADKKYMFNLEQRLGFLKKCFEHEPKIKVTTYEGLTVDFCQDQNVQFILRGLRNGMDLEFEKAIAQTNFKMSGVETLFLIASSGKSHMSSTIVRDVMRNGGDYSFMVPKDVKL